MYGSSSSFHLIIAQRTIFENGRILSTCGYFSRILKQIHKEMRTKWQIQNRLR